MKTALVSNCRGEGGLYNESKPHQHFELILCLLYPVTKTGFAEHLAEGGLWVEDKQARSVTVPVNERVK